MSFDAKPLQIKACLPSIYLRFLAISVDMFWNKENWSELYEDLKFLIENKNV